MSDEVPQFGLQSRNERAGLDLNTSALRNVRENVDGNIRNSHDFA